MLTLKNYLGFKLNGVPGILYLATLKPPLATQQRPVGVNYAWCQGFGAKASSSTECALMLSCFTGEGSTGLVRYQGHNCERISTFVKWSPSSAAAPMFSLERQSNEWGRRRLSGQAAGVAATLAREIWWNPVSLPQSITPNTHADALSASQSSLCTKGSPRGRHPCGLRPTTRLVWGGCLPCWGLLKSCPPHMLWQMAPTANHFQGPLH